LPLSLDGTRGARAGHAEAFTEGLRAVVPVPIVAQDERFTTVQAERGLRDAGMKGRDRKAVVDAEAARILLQAWLDAARNPASSG
jgi:putative Holliday junction resolvase